MGLTFEVVEGGFMDIDVQVGPCALLHSAPFHLLINEPWRVKFVGHTFEVG